MLNSWQIYSDAKESRFIRYCKTNLQVIGFCDQLRYIDLVPHGHEHNTIISHSLSGNDYVG
jgi:hypothetical protein